MAGREHSTTQEHIKLINFLDNIVSEDSSSFRHQVLNCLAKFFCYEQSTFFIVDEEKELKDPVALNIDNHSLQNYCMHYYSTDIFHPKKALSQFFKKTVLSVQDVMTIKEYEKTEFYNEFLRTQGIYDELAVGLFNRDKMIGGIGLFKPHKNRFKRDDIDRMRLLSNFIAQILLKNMLLWQTLNKQQMLEQSISKAPLGVAILNRNNSVVLANQAAEEMAREIAGKDIELEDFISSISTWREADLLQGATKTILSPSLREFVVRINSFSIPSKMDHFLVLICPASFYKNLEPELQEEYQLTKRELEVLSLVLKGYTNEEISREVFISIPTVKSHLSKLFKKFDVTNRTSLSRKVYLTNKGF